MVRVVLTGRSTELVFDLAWLSSIFQAPQSLLVAGLVWLLYTTPG